MQGRRYFKNTVLGFGAKIRFQVCLKLQLKICTGF